MKNPQTFIIILIAVIAVVFSVKQTAVVKKQQAEISILKEKQANYENQFNQLTQEKNTFEARFNETLNHLRQITQTKQSLDSELENAQSLINKLEDEKKSFGSSIQNISKGAAAVQSKTAVAILRGEMKYWNKSITKTTKEVPVIEIKDVTTGETMVSAKVSVKGSKYTIENLPLGKYEVSVRVKVPTKKDQHVPDELKGSVSIEIFKAGKTVDQDITLQ